MVILHCYLVSAPHAFHILSLLWLIVYQWFKSCIVNICYCLLSKRLELCLSARFNLCNAVNSLCSHCLAIVCGFFSVFCIRCYCVVCCYLFVAEHCAAVMHSCHGHHLQRAVIVHMLLANVFFCVFLHHR